MPKQASKPWLEVLPREKIVIENCILKKKQAEKKKKKEITVGSLYPTTDSIRRILHNLVQCIHSLGSEHTTDHPQTYKPPACLVWPWRLLLSQQGV